MSSLIDTALALAMTGVPVFPCTSDKSPAIPRSAGGRGFLDASTDPTEIERMFRFPGAALIGVPTGEITGEDVLDIDFRNGGGEWYDANKHRLPATLIRHTGSGGLHLRFRHHSGVRSSGQRIAPGIDTRGDGGYAIAWWLHGCGTTGDTALDWPAWLLPLVLPPTRAGSAATASLDELAPPSAADLVLLLVSMPNPAETSRDDYVALNLAVQGCIRALDDPDSESGIMDAAADWSSRWDSPRAASFQAERDRWDGDWSLRDNDIAGWRHVVGHAARLGVDVSSHRAAAARDEFAGVPLPATPPVTLSPETMARARFQGPDELLERKTAVTFGETHRGLVVYDKIAQTWAVYQDRVWRRDESGRVNYLVQEYVEACRSAAGGGDKASGSAGFVGGVERLARHLPVLAASSDIWDQDPWLAGVPGGTVDLRTGIVTPGSAEQYISKRFSVAPAAPGTDTPLWSGFLATTTSGSAEDIRWLQKIAGYYLTGDVSEEIFVIFYGDGGTGKGTFLRTWSDIAADYGYQTPSDFFNANSRSNPDYQRAKIAGRRVVFTSEPESGAPLAEGLVKELTGNEGKTNAREPYGRPFEFRSQAKYLVATNHAPKIRTRSKALERRLRIVPFLKTPGTPDLTLKKALVAEYPGILRWMIDGCLLWQREGLGTCPAVQQASKAYFDEQDKIGQWLADNTIEHKDLGVSRIDLRTDYAAWCHAAGERPLPPHELYEVLRRRPGVSDSSVKGIRSFRGIGIRAATGEFPIEKTDGADIVRLFSG